MLSKYLPPEVGQNKRDLLERLRQLNRIRNNVMHPVRGGQLSEEEFEFVYNLEDDLGPLSAPENVNREPEAAAEPQTQEPAQSEAPAAPELVSQLTPVEEAPPPQQIAVTNEQAAEEEFIPSIKAS